eukprot:gene19370-21291_t
MHSPTASFLEEVKWLIRIILKDLKIGLNENNLFPIFHPDAQELYNVCSSLSKVCHDLSDPYSSSGEAAITLFNPFRPMLGQRAAYENVENLMNHNPFYIETKIDGERIQLHKNKGEFRYFSRRCHDYSDSFGVTEFRGTLTPHVTRCFSTDLVSCILDGEMIAFDADNDVFVPKGTNIDIKAATLEIFDVLSINGEVLANLPLSERLQRLEGMVKPIPRRLEFVERKQASTREEVVTALNDIIDKRGEGIVVKNPASVYKPNKRKGSGWFKIKPDYVDSLSDQLDVLIVGGHYGVGRHGGMISHFLCAVAVPPQNPNDYPSVFQSFCKVGSGISLKELRDLCQDLNKHWRKFNPSNPPSNIQLGPGLKEKPDVWIEPSKSAILQIRAAEITQSEKFKCGYTLRFPRVDKIRTDKNWFDCMTLDELDNLRSSTCGYLPNKGIDDDGVSQPVAKKRRGVATKIETSRSVAAHLKGADITNIKEVSKLFKDYEFCVMNGSNEHSKGTLERQIAERGGTFTQNPCSSTYCVIAEKVNVRVKNVISRGEFDVVTVDWLVKCLDKDEVLAYMPQDLIFASTKTKDKLAEYFDKYGDSYTEDVTQERLHKIFSELKYEVEISADEIAEIESRYFPNESQFGLFRRCQAYVDCWSEIGGDTSEKTSQDIDLLALEFQFYGGQISACLDKDVTHVLVDKTATARLSILRERIRQMKRKPHIVSDAWVRDCIAKSFIMEERLYEPS